MTGQELKNIIEKTALGKGKIAEAMGITSQALVQKYKTVDLRQETISKLDIAIQKLTDKKKRLSDYIGNNTQVSETVQSDSKPQEVSNSQVDAFGFAAQQLGVMTSTMLQALSEMNKRESELDERLRRMAEKEIHLDSLISKLELLLKANPPGLEGFIGNMQFPTYADSAAEDVQHTDSENKNSKA